MVLRLDLTILFVTGLISLSVSRFYLLSYTFSEYEALHMFNTIIEYMNEACEQTNPNFSILHLIFLFRTRRLRLLVNNRDTNDTKEMRNWLCYESLETAFVRSFDHQSDTFDSMATGDSIAAMIC